MKYVYLFSLLMSFSSLFSMSHKVASYKMACLNKCDSNFHVLLDDKKFVVPNYMVSKTIRESDTDALNVLLSNGSAYLSLNPYPDGKCALDIKGRVKGGGPLTAAVLYWATKVTCYGTAAAAVSGVVVTTGGAALGAATASIAGGAGLIVESVAVGGSLAVGGIGAGVTVAGSAIAGGAAAIGATEALAIGTVGAVTSSGGIAAAVAMVEAASMGAFAFGLMLPLP